MEISFDIAEDELQVFLAEADEQLQMLDEGLVRLEREGDDSELLQSIFRAAHTLKGSAGTIGHHRMADLTHAMESALDGLRKGSLAVSAPLVDGLLESLDALRALLNEVIEGQASPVDISPLVGHLSRLVAPPSPPDPPPAGLPGVEARADGGTPQLVRPKVAPAVKKARRSESRNGRSRAKARSGASGRARTAKNGKANGKENGRVPRARVGTRSPRPHSNGRANGKKNGRVLIPPTGRSQAKSTVSASGGRSRTAHANGARSNGRTRSAKKAAGAPLAASAGSVTVVADIAPGSVASAARALQVVMALRGLGEIVRMNPGMEVIESAAPVRRLLLGLATDRSEEEIGAALAWISDIEKLVIGEAEIPLNSSAAPVGQPPRQEPGGEPAGEQAAPTASADGALQRLGDFLVSAGYVTRAQLEAALHRQGGEAGGGALLGQTLVRMGAISQETLDQAVAHQIQQLRSALKSVQAAAPAEGRGRGRAADKTVRTSVERLDSLMNLVGELITDRNRLVQIRGEFEARFRGDDRVEDLAQTAIHIGRITDQLQEEVMRIRMLPISMVFNKLPRLVRDLARKAGKQVDLVVRGEDTELDRSVIEEIGDPLIHLLRNAVDHGLEAPAERAAAGKAERGTIRLTAAHEESRIILTVEDDGRGIDTERVKASAVRKGLITEAEAAAVSHEEAVHLIFRSGLSTAQVVSDISGRGVGMDIVRANIERLSGTITVETSPGRGTQFHIALPLTLAIIPALLVRLTTGTFAIPLSCVMEALRVTEKDIHTVRGRPVTRLRGSVLPLVQLSQALGFAAGARARSGTPEYVVAVRWGKLQMGLMVDSLVGEQELVIKSLGALVGETPGVSGAAILGDGRVALIVDVPELFKRMSSTA